MLNFLRLTGFVFASVLFMSAAVAEDYGPSDTSSWVASCDTNFENCRHEVVNIHNLNLIDTLSDRHGCTIPTAGKMRADSAVATHAIIGWLNANTAVRATKTDDAVNQAIAALWPSLCQY